jgi:hypothetical protein
MSQTRLGEVLGGLGVGLLALWLAHVARRHARWAEAASSRPSQRRGPAAAKPPCAAAAADPTPHIVLADIARLRSNLEALYMPATSLVELADCWLRVEGLRLPAHSQVLSAQAGVLRDFVLAARESGGLQSDGGPIDLTPAFSGSSLAAVTCLLHFLYSPAHADAPTLAALERGGQLVSVARLAHKLDAAAVLQAVEQYLLGMVGSAPAALQAAALQLAEDCHLGVLCSRCIALLSAQLAAAGPFWRDVLSHGALAACRSDSLAELACQLAETVDAAAFSPPRLFNVRHAPGGGAGDFCFRIDDASWRLANRCAPVLSPWVSIGGFEFRVWVYMNGNVDGTGNSVSVYLYCNTEHAVALGVQEVQAAYEFEVGKSAGVAAVNNQQLQSSNPRSDSRMQAIGR